MQKESLIEIRNKIIDILYKSDIDPLDKGELAINLYHFLDEEKYESNVKILKSTKEDKQITIEEYVKTLKPKGNKNEY